LHYKKGKNLNAEKQMAYITHYLDQRADGSGITDDRMETAYGPNVIAAMLRGYPTITDGQRETLYQAAMQSPEVCKHVDALLRALGPVWRDLETRAGYPESVPESDPTPSHLRY
jgi:hypothetical protein